MNHNEMEHHLVKEHKPPRPRVLNPYLCCRVKIKIKRYNKGLVLKISPNQLVRETLAKETSFPLISYLESHCKSISDDIRNARAISLISIASRDISTNM